ncbi:MAG: hypothetical protein GXY44_11510 [Phycisphaerales bacterium]|nr:hypothetical protein [Phycisphaerales bacterium]
MAKQNVNFIQRHVEKLIVGATGAVLLATIVFYAVQTPNVATVGSTKLSPGAFYQEVEEKTVGALERMKSARPDDSLLSPLPESIAEITDNKLNMPAPLVTAWIPPNPGLGEIGPADGPVEKIHLAEILSPSRPTLTTGRGLAALPEPSKLLLLQTGFGGIGREESPRGGTRGGAASFGIDSPIKDCYWVTVITALFYKEQIDLFKKAEYHDDRSIFSVAGFDVARQELLPDGQWGADTIVTPYRSKDIIPSDILLRRQEDGSYVFDPPTQEIRNSYLAAVQAGSSGNDTLRPPFATYLTEAYRAEWKLPDVLPGINVDLSLYAQESRPLARFSEAPSGDARDTRTARRADPGRTPAAGDERTQRRLLARKMEEAQKALDEQRFLDAEILLDDIERDPAAEEQLIREVRTLRLRYVNEFRTARAAVAPSTQVRDVPVEPAWVNDTTVMPGRTYRYRMRVLAVNNYFGYQIPLANPNEATKLLLAGAWSEWSLPVTVRNDTYLILDRVTTPPPLARVEVYHWANGIWSSGRTEVGIGQRIALAGSGFNFEYDGIIVDIQPERPFWQRVERDNVFSVRQRTSATITAVNSRGEVSEHIALEDRGVKKTIEDERQALLDARTGGGVSPGPRRGERDGFRERD